MSEQQVVCKVALETHSCGQCGGTYALNADYIELKRQQSGYWNCPYCQTQWGWGHTSENERLKKELEFEKRRAAFAQQNAANERAAREHTEKRLAAQKGANTKIRKRVGNGVCPCCTRSFVNVQRHMETQHPEFKVAS